MYEQYEPQKNPSVIVCSRKSKTSVFKYKNNIDFRTCGYDN